MSISPNWTSDMEKALKAKGVTTVYIHKHTNNVAVEHNGVLVNAAGYLKGIYHYPCKEAPSSDLVSFRNNGKDFKVHKDCIERLKEMLKANPKLKLASAFRAYNYTGKYTRKDKDLYKDGKLPTVAPQGFSQHHTGCAIDFDPISDSFANTAEYKWLRENAHKYGFVQTYQNSTVGKGKKFGEMEQESWHWCYQGTAKVKELLGETVI